MFDYTDSTVAKITGYEYIMRVERNISLKKIRQNNNGDKQAIGSCGGDSGGKFFGILK